MPRPDTFWDLASRYKLIRVSGFGEVQPLDRGVNYFVLALESLGAKTHFSCEGHPAGFYILFEAPYRVAAKIAKCGFFDVQIDQSRRNWWHLRPWGGVKHDDESGKRQFLRMAAQTWAQKLSLDILFPEERAA